MGVQNAQRAPNDADGFLRNINDMITSFQTSGVDAELRMALLESAVSIVRATGCEIRRASPVRYSDSTMRYEFYVEQSASQCANVNFAIAETLTEQFDEAHPELITFVCRPLGSFTPRGTSIEVER